MNYQKVSYSSLIRTCDSYFGNIVGQSAAWCLGLLKLIKEQDNTESYQTTKQDLWHLFSEIARHELLPLFILSLIKNQAPPLLWYIGASLIYPYVLYKGFYSLLKAMLLGNPVTIAAIEQEKATLTLEKKLIRLLRDPVADNLSLLTQFFIYWYFQAPHWGNLPGHLFASYLIGAYLVRMATSHYYSSSNALAFGLIHQLLVMGILTKILEMTLGTVPLFTHYTLSLLLIPLEIKIIANSPIPLKKEHSTFDVFFRYEAISYFLADTLISGGFNQLINRLNKYPDDSLKQEFLWLSIALQASLTDKIKQPWLKQLIKALDFVFIKQVKEQLNQLQSIKKMKKTHQNTLHEGAKWLRDYNFTIRKTRTIPLLGVVLDPAVKSAADLLFKFSQDAFPNLPSLFFKINTLEEFQTLLNALVNFLRPSMPIDLPREEVPFEIKKIQMPPKIRLELLPKERGLASFTEGCITFASPKKLSTRHQLFSIVKPPPRKSLPCLPGK